MPSGLVLRCCVLLGLCLPGGAGGGVVSRLDAFGSYRVGNQRQCQRLCWYRSLCSSFSYRPHSSGDTNCVLHTDTVAAVAVAEAGWVESLPTAEGITGHCRSRPCPDSHVCTRSPHPHSTHHCLPVPGVCPGGQLQGETSRAECNLQYVLTPKGVNDTLVCQVTGAWTAFAGVCKQSEFNFPAPGVASVTKDLPWEMEDSSSLCVRGTFSSQGQLEINFFFTSNTFLHLGFRYTSSQSELRYTEKINGAWQTDRTKSPMGLTPGNPYVISLHLLPGILSVQIHQLQTYNLTDVALAVLRDALMVEVKHIGGTGNAQLTYVHLTAACS